MGFMQERPEKRKRKPRPEPELRFDPKKVFRPSKENELAKLEEELELDLEAARYKAQHGQAGTRGGSPSSPTVWSISSNMIVIDFNKLAADTTTNMYVNYPYDFD